ncbi:MAG: phosphoribosylformylglycinamidine synthase I [Firmicutes bacterium]|nr:phosphoribosylformylglycinamidine synthase I [Bacillota bacterium]
MTPKLGILYAPGTNCHEETAFAVEYAGGRPAILLLDEVIARPRLILDYAALIIPGGFSYGDHLAAGRIFAVRFVHHLAEILREFLAGGRPILGICNGDQILMETGLLPAGTIGERHGALTRNRSARFEDRWVALAAAEETFWTAGLVGRPLRLPSAHGEGRLVVAPGDGLRVAFHYVDEKGRPTEAYPANPSGSPGGIAGIYDPGGLVLGLMPHPERAVLPVHGSQDGLGIFANLVRFCTGA